MNKQQMNQYTQNMEDQYGLARAELRVLRQELANAKHELGVTKKALTFARLPWYRRWFRKRKG